MPSLKTVSAKEQRLPSYPAYKGSGVEWLGEIPEDWNIGRLQHGATIHLSSVDKKSSDDEIPVRLCNYTDVYYGSHIVDASGFMKATATPSEIKRHRLREGDVIVTKDSESRDDIAVPAVSTRDFDDVVCGYHLAQIRPGSNLHGPYLYYGFLSPVIGSQFEASATGITRYAIGYADLKSSLFPFPPHPEQRAIAAFLDRETEKIDALIEMKQRLIERLEEKRTALISHTVTKGLDPDAEMKDSGVEWLGEIPKGWDVVKLKFLADVQGGVAKGKKYSDDVETCTLPYLRVANVQDGYLDLSSVSEIEVSVAEARRYSLRAGDVLMNEGGDYDKLGRGTVWNGEIKPCLHQNHVFAVRPHQIESDWLAQVMQASYAKHFFIRKSVQSTNLASISMTSLQDFPVVVPSESERQNILEYIVRQSARLADLVQVTRKGIDHLKEYRTALISAAVTGKIEVRDKE